MCCRAERSPCCRCDGWSPSLETLRRFGRRIGLKTTGYHLAGLPRASLDCLDQITLANHGVNQAAIDAALAHLSENFRGRLKIETVETHRDTRAIVRHGRGTADQGRSCDHLMSTLTLIPPVVYPCCNSWAIMHNLNDDTLRQELVAAGWTTDNPELRATLQAWRQTLPPHFFSDICASSCYKTCGTATFPAFPIVPHPEDRILKPRGLL